MARMPSAAPLPTVTVIFDFLNELATENLALRQQIAVLKRSVNRAKIEDSDRIFWILMKRLLKNWKECLPIVKPETVIRWHRKGFADYWRRKSRSKPGRPPIPMGLILLIRRLSQENVTWGAPRELTHFTSMSQFWRWARTCGDGRSLFQASSSQERNRHAAHVLMDFNLRN